MHFSIKSCPELIRKNLKDVFPLVGLSSLRVGKELTMITLSYEKDTDYEHAAKNVINFETMLSTILPCVCL